MKIEDLRELLKNKEVVDEIHKHLWIESQKAGYSIGMERATDEWLRLYAVGWMKYHMPQKYDDVMKKKAQGEASKSAEKKPAKKTAVQKIVKKKIK